MRIAFEPRPGTYESVRRGDPALQREPRHLCLAGSTRPRESGCDLQAQRYEDIGTGCGRPLRRVESRDPDPVVAHSRIVVRFGERNGRLDGRGVEVSFGGEI